jgi:phosphate transport system permease protein
MSAVPSSQGQRVLEAARCGSPRPTTLRDARERVVRGLLLLAAVFSVLTTTTIVGTLAWETFHFIRLPEVTLSDFLLGTTWSPLLGAEKHFGIWPLVCGTLLVSAVGAAFALPVGLITAVYLSEYAPPRVRATLKPVLEVLAGVPTVVYGFFALMVITPALQSLCTWAFGRPVFPGYNATGAGLAVGVMILPIVTSLSEDALRAVPRGLREGAHALGGTRFDVSVRVVVPAALSGIMASFFLAITRAIGETMIVALAAGGLAQLTFNPASETQTMTAYMVQIFLGDAPAFGVENLSSYAVAAVLFVITLALTMVGNLLLRMFREEYE